MPSSGTDRIFRNAMVLSLAAHALVLIGIPRWGHARVSPLPRDISFLIENVVSAPEPLPDVSVPAGERVEAAPVPSPVPRPPAPEGTALRSVSAPRPAPPPASAGRTPLVPRPAGPRRPDEAEGIAPEYKVRVRGRILANYSYPASLRERGIVGTVVILFQIQPSGYLEWTRVLKSSGHPRLDSLAEATVRKSAPFPRTDPGRDPSLRLFNIRFVYGLAAE
ncbi:MAG: energy transducer TonB [Planctomycetota bacterium]